MEGYDNTLQRGLITDTSENKVSVQGASEYTALPLCLPYGITAVPPAGSEAVILAGGGDGRLDVCAGVVSSSWAEPGEIVLRSAGGAEIILKNNGDVLINGTVF